MKNHSRHPEQISFGVAFITKPVGASGMFAVFLALSASRVRIDTGFPPSRYLPHLGVSSNTHSTTLETLNH